MHKTISVAIYSCPPPQKKKKKKKKKLVNEFSDIILLDCKVDCYNGQDRFLLQYNLKLTHIEERLIFHTSKQNCMHPKKNGDAE
jgi:hypothetical protein